MNMVLIGDCDNIVPVSSLKYVPMDVPMAYIQAVNKKNAVLYHAGLMLPGSGKCKYIVAGKPESMTGVIISAAPRNKVLGALEM